MRRFVCPTKWWATCFFLVVDTEWHLTLCKIFIDDADIKDQLTQIFELSSNGYVVFVLLYVFMSSKLRYNLQNNENHDSVSPLALADIIFLLLWEILEFGTLSMLSI